jgi:SpoIID/LytB domain
MRKKVFLVIISILILLFLFFRGIYNRINQDQQKDQPANPVIHIQKEEIVTRAEVMKMLALLYDTKSDIDSLERTIPYEDSDPNQWYDKYINACYSLGLLEQGTEDTKKIRPMDHMTYEECLQLLTKLKVNQTSLPISLADKKKTDFLKKTEWMTLFQFLITQCKDNKIEEKELYILGTQDNKVVTNEGTFDCDGIAFKDLTDKKYKALIKENEIVAVQEEVKSATVLPNVWIINGENKQISVFVNGCNRTFQSQNILSQSMNKVVGDLTIDQGIVTKVSIKPDIISGKVLAANDKYIELEKYGKLYLDDNYKIYHIYDELGMEQTSGILVGYQSSDFVVANGKICAVLIKEAIKAKDIRVLIKTNGFENLFHQKVKVTANCAYTIKCGKKVKHVKKGKTVTYTTNSKLLKTGRIIIKPDKEGGKIKLLSIKRSGSYPSYRGSIEITSCEEGLTIINELPLEEYLYAVIPSEMPTSYGEEALKVQAICARSYAYQQLLCNSYSAYGAHVDDSVSYQVYNNTPENEQSILAVKDTYGKILQYNGKVVNAYYFSTSCGYTSSADEVWMSPKTIPYLVGKLQTMKPSNTDADLNLKDETTFRKFIEKCNYKTYDSQFAWFRWKVTISSKDIKRVIDANLKSRYEANPNLILTLNKSGKYTSVPIDTIGDVTGMEIVKRQTGGIATELVIKGSKNTIKVLTEYNIRILLAPLYDTIVRKDKSVVKNLSMLPSAFFVVDPVKSEDKVKGFCIHGGGYGHGVGMSQNGVKAMVDDGKKYEEILQYYYKGAQIGNLY